MRLVIFGPPGSGKGTQAQLLADRLNMRHISTGDILREAVRSETPLGLEAKPLMEQGQYVPDELINGIIIESFRRSDRPERFLMDGYPRTLAQARAFSEVLKEQDLELDGAVLLDVTDEEIIERISGRRFCPKDNAVYHIANMPPKEPGRCDQCNSLLQLRADDEEDTIRERLRVYKETLPEVLAYYWEQGMLRQISGSGNVDDIFNSILESLGVQP